MPQKLPSIYFQNHEIFTINKSGTWSSYLQDLQIIL